MRRRSADVGNVVVRRDRGPEACVEVVVPASRRSPWPVRRRCPARIRLLELRPGGLRGSWRMSGTSRLAPAAGDGGVVVRNTSRSWHRRRRGHAVGKVVRPTGRPVRVVCRVGVTRRSDSGRGPGRVGELGHVADSGWIGCVGVGIGVDQVRVSVVSKSVTGSVGVDRPALSTGWSCPCRSYGVLEGERRVDLAGRVAQVRGVHERVTLPLAVARRGCPRCSAGAGR